MTSKTSHFGSCSVGKWQEQQQQKQTNEQSIFNAWCTTYVELNCIYGTTIYAVFFSLLFFERKNCPIFGSNTKKSHTGPYGITYNVNGNGKGKHE